ncbi:hypothetical protein B0H16DRAFT_1327909, partial [Mycena metata]
CNVGDALALFSGGILTSNLHRVPPLGQQSRFERWSLVYLTRPGNDIELRTCPKIAEAVALKPKKNFNTGCAALQRFTRRIKNE